MKANLKLTARLRGGTGGDAALAAQLVRALGGLKGPIMKVAQLMATIPDLLPPEYAADRVRQPP